MQFAADVHRCGSRPLLMLSCNTYRVHRILTPDVRPAWAGGPGCRARARSAAVVRTRIVRCA